jgi:hypothetical protein
LVSNASEETFATLGFVQEPKTTNRKNKKKVFFKSFYSKINKKKTIIEMVLKKVFLV